MHQPTDRIAHTTTFVTPVVDDWLQQILTIKPDYMNMSPLLHSLMV